MAIRDIAVHRDESVLGLRSSASIGSASAFRKCSARSKIRQRPLGIPSEVSSEEHEVRLPNFIIIGAAKAGTTALYWYLSEHPAVFMSRVKETNYFAYGVDDAGRLLYGDPDVHRFPVKSLAEYEQLFAEAGAAPAVGEASPIYLECPQAPGRIQELLPAARLICSLRHPVERAYADYLMYLWRRGRRFEPARDLTATAVWARPDSRWMSVSRYHEQLSRYFDGFPRDRSTSF